MRQVAVVEIDLAERGLHCRAHVWLCRVLSRDRRLGVIEHVRHREWMSERIGELRKQRPERVRDRARLVALRRGSIGLALQRPRVPLSVMTAKLASQSAMMPAAPRPRVAGERNFFVRYMPLSARASTGRSSRCRRTSSPEAVHRWYRRPGSRRSAMSMIVSRSPRSARPSVGDRGRRLRLGLANDACPVRGIRASEIQRPLAREQLVQHDAQRVHVGRCSHGLAEHLLRLAYSGVKG